MEDEKTKLRGASPLDWKISRRGFIKAFGGMVIGSAAFGIGGITYMTAIEPDWLEVKSVELSLPRLDPAFAGFRLAQISDIHISEAVTAEEIAEAFQKVLDAKPDLVAFTGDYIHRRKRVNRSREALTPLLRSLAEQVETLAVLGNHDYWVSARATREMLEQAGIRELRNQAVTLRRGEAKLHFVGVDDPWDGRPDLREALSGLPQDGAAILLAHEPDYADTSVQTGRFDLQISGHTHGGQIVLPLVGPPVRPYMGRKYPVGLYQVGNMLQYTNRGLGMTSPFVRLNCRPEVTIFTFQPKRA